MGIEEEARRKRGNEEGARRKEKPKGGDQNEEESNTQVNENQKDTRDEMYIDLVVALSRSFGQNESNLFREIIEPYMMNVLRSNHPENYKQILKSAIDNGYRKVLFHHRCFSIGYGP